MKASRFFVSAAILSAVLLLSAACGRPKDEKAQGASGPGKTAGEAQSTSATGQHGFEPDLLLSDARTIEFAVELPLVSARLSDTDPYMAQVKLAVECSNAETRDEAEKKKKDLATTVGTLLSEKSMSALSSTAAKLQLQEDIVSRIKQRLTNQGVKQVYYLDFAIERGT
jgi:flagellar basal body-associated protein FliL